MLDGPFIRQEFVELIGWVVADPGDYVSQVGIGIDIIYDNAARKAWEVL